MSFNENLKKKISNNYKPQDAKIILPGIIAEIVFNKEVFKKNIELKEFTKIFDNEYADYLYKARPLLFARLIKEFMEISEEKELLIYVNKIEKYLNLNIEKPENVKKNKPVKGNNSTTKNIESWGKIINPGRYNED
ncbi:MULTISPECIES: hypothetical protein [unclassified Mammaliicoccus]|uniref:hypothetical protein n=1 Tax=unclassified Mammaliicoccus TaxID=2803851 RepID=UPI001EFB7E3E|nr:MULTISPECIES: hypothetical protein [unclassified Mammaliicoccus]